MEEELLRVWVDWWEFLRWSQGATLAEALGTQAEHSAGFMISAACRKGAIGTTYKKTMAV